MKTKLTLIALFISIIFLPFSLLGQNQYDEFANIADSLFLAKDYKNAANKYSETFKSIGWKGLPDHRYNAACAWAMIQNSDSAFFQLNRIVNKSYFSDYQKVMNQSEFKFLYTDRRWDLLINLMKSNAAKLNMPLISKLDSIHKEDQKYRLQIDSISNKFGFDSREMSQLWNIIHIMDAENQIKILEILDKHGWLGQEEIGVQGNQTLFLVIQHANIDIQLKYLPVMREAVKNGKAFGGDLALLEDRVSLAQGRKQIYGSQIGRNESTKKYYVLPLKDPENVDKRRASVGLNLLAEYVKTWQIVWNVEQYKKDLP